MAGSKESLPTLQRQVFGTNRSVVGRIGWYGEIETTIKALVHRNEAVLRIDCHKTSRRTPEINACRIIIVKDLPLHINGTPAVMADSNTSIQHRSELGHNIHKVLFPVRRLLPIASGSVKSSATSIWRTYHRVQVWTCM